MPRSRPAGPLVLRRTLTDDVPYERLSIEPIQPTIGAIVSGVDLRALDDATVAELDRALCEWKVLVFRDQPLNPDEHIAFAQHWGPLWDDQLIPTPDRNPREMLVQFTRDATTAGYENEWHADGTFRETPTLGTVLRSVEVPPVGGDTLFADMAAAYDNLSDDLRTQIDGAFAEHDWVESYGAKYAEQLDELRAALPPVVHPVVRTHPVTGRRSLFVNRYFTKRILGVEPDVSERLLDELLAQAERPEFQCRVKWQPDTVAFWDNRTVLHYGCSDYFPHRRTMARATIAGDRPR